MAAEKRDELEELIELQQGKKPKAPSAKPMPQQETAEFSGMQQSIMEEGAPAMSVEQMPQLVAQPAMQPSMPEPSPEIIEQPQFEPEEQVAAMQEPSLPVAQLTYNRTNVEEIESLIESVVEEKWRQAMESFEDFNLWKEKARVEIISVKQELLRLQQRFENMEKAMIGKVHDYDIHVLNIGAEIKAMEKVLQKILEPLAQNVRELDRITKSLKK